MAIVLDEPTFIDIILNYALYAGAIFQLVCIFAVVALPSTTEEKITESLKTPAALISHTVKPAHDSSGRRSKKDKKKHR